MTRRDLRHDAVSLDLGVQRRRLQPQQLRSTRLAARRAAERRANKTHFKLPYFI